MVRNCPFSIATFMSSMLGSKPCVAPPAICAGGWRCQKPT